MDTKLRTFTRHLSVTVAAIVAVTLLSTSIASAATTSGLSDLTLAASASSNLGTGANEFSGATYNADRSVMLVVDDGGSAHEFDVEFDGSIDFSSPIRSIDLRTGGDPEGVAWISGDRYAIVHEDTGVVAIVDVPATANPIVNGDDIVDTFSVVPDDYVDVNTGPEGLATDGTFWYTVNEKPATLSRFTPDGSPAGSIDLSSDLSDASGVTIADGDTLLVLSHESGVVNHYDADWSTSSVDLLGQLNVSSFPQAEGIALVGTDRLHVWGENKGGTTYARYDGTISIIDSTVVGDVDCSGSMTLLDARITAMLYFGTAQPDDNCGPGDVNGDNEINLFDARLIAQCSINVPNEVCPFAALN